MALRFLSGGGAMGQMMRDHDWSTSPLGKPTSWPLPLRTIAGVMLSANQPMFAVWGPEQAMIYNDGYAEILGNHHPGALGRPFFDVWHELVDEVGPIMTRAYAGEPTSMNDIMLTMQRRGYPEETHFSFFYAPLRDEAGNVGGVLCGCTEITGQVFAERARIAELDRLHVLFSHSPSFLALLRGPDHVYEMVNPSYMQLIGHREVTGRPVSAALPEVEAQGYLALLDQVYHTGVPYSAGAARIYLQRTPGAAPELRMLDLLFQPMRNDAGAVTGILVNGNDVTERHTAEIQLRNSEERFRTLAQALPNHVWSARPDGHVDWFNEQVRAYAGEVDHALEGAGWLSIVHPDDTERALAAWRQALATETLYEVEFRIRRRDGAYRWFLARALPMRDADGVLTHWLGTNTDMEDQRAAREILLSTNAALEQRVEAHARERDRIWNLSQDLLAVVSADGYFRNVNPAWTRILGFRPDEIIGRHVHDLVHPADRGVTLQALDQAVHETVSQFENRYLHKDGSFRWFSWSASHDSNGVVYANGRHITAEKEAAIALARTEEALRHAQKMDAVGQLTGGIAHDFNNLLQGITGSLELLRLRIDAGRFDHVERFVSGAINSANRAAALTHRLLAFSRRQPLDPKAVKVNALVASMEDLLRRTLGERIRIELVLAGGLWPTMCDPNQLENAILNLCINARDAMPDGGKLTIETGNAYLDDSYTASVRDLAPGQYACICVSDTGTGMSRDVIERAFEPFFTTKPLGQGTGLGLSMIYGFAQQSEGHVRLYSEVGRGTTVKLYLPRFRGVLPGEDALPQPDEARLSPARETVLVVEDEPVVRALIVDVLHELGYRALEADDGPSGLEILQSHATVDVLITDIGLPGLNGRQLADAGRLVRPALKVLFMTGYAENAAVANGFLEHGMEMITKPFAMERLAARVREIVERK